MRISGMLIVVMSLLWGMSIAPAQDQKTKGDAKSAKTKKTSKPKLTGPKPEPIDAPAPSQVKQSVRRGVNFLVKDQNKDGSWGSARNTKGLNIYAPVPGAHHAFRGAVTAMCVSALIQTGDERAEVQDAIKKGETWLLENMPKNKPLEIRDLAIFELFYSSGLRLAELAGLDLFNIDFSDASLQVIGKGSKARRTPVGTKALAAIRLWLVERSNIANVAETAVFVSLRGTRLSHRAIQQRLKHWGQQIGLSTPVHPHKLRHSFATHMLKNGADLRSLQLLLGHENLSTVQIYTHLETSYLRSVYDKKHPRS
jgi:hypothetical protein